MPNKVAVFQLQEMFKRLVDAVPEVGLSRSTRVLLFTTIQHILPPQVKFQLYSFNSLLPKYEEALEPSSWMDHTQVQVQRQRSSAKVVDEQEDKENKDSLKSLT